MPVKNGDIVKIEYEGKLEDGTVFDSSAKHGQPLEFKIGSGKVIKGMEKAVLGMEINDEKEVDLQPSEAYGDRVPGLVKKIPRDQLPPGQEIRSGALLVLSLPSGIKVPAKITEVTDSGATIDLNHPLAGKVLKFKIKVIDISS